MVTPYAKRTVTFAHPIANVIPNPNEQNSPSSHTTNSLDSDSQSSDSDSPHESDSDETDSDSELSAVESDISFDDDVYLLASETTPSVVSSDVPTAQTLEFLTTTKTTNEK